MKFENSRGWLSEISDNVNCTMSLSKIIQNSCQELLQAIRSSSLNYCVQETPFSIYLTVRKSVNPNFKNATSASVNSHETEKKIKILEAENSALNQNYADAVAELENQTKTIGKLEVTIHQLHKKIDESKETDEASINTLQIKNEQLRAENKNVKNQNEELNEDLVHTRKLLKSSEELSSEHLEKKVFDLEEKLADHEYLKINNVRLKSATERLNNDVVRVRSKAKLEKERITKDHKKEIKAWKKKLSHEVKLKKKPEKLIHKEDSSSRIFASSDLLLNNCIENNNFEDFTPKACSTESFSRASPFFTSVSGIAEHASSSIQSSKTRSIISTNTSMVSFTEESETSCTICAEIIADYMPKYFKGIETNPACINCQNPSSPDITPMRDSNCLDSTNRDSRCLDSTTRDSTSLDSTLRDSTCLDSITSLDMIGLDSTYLVTTSKKSFYMDSVQLPKKSLFPPWTYDVCKTDIPWGHTWEQTIHSKKHRDEPKY